MSRVFLFDANILITAHNQYYEIGRIDQFWDWLITQGEQGNIKIPTEIFSEITSGNDQLSEWAKRNQVKTALTLKEEIQQESLQSVLQNGYGLQVPSETDLEKMGKDPFLIAAALTWKLSRVVVTGERSSPKKMGANRKVPDVCKALGIESCDLFKVIRELDFRA